MEKENEGKEEITTPDNNGAGDKPTQDELNKQTNDAAKRLETANTEAERINAESKARIALGGTADAGSGVVKEKKEETAKEYNNRIEKEISEGKYE